MNSNFLYHGSIKKLKGKSLQPSQPDDLEQDPNSLIKGIYATDIKPKGFKTIEIDEFVSDSTVKETRKILENPALVKEMTEYNYQLGKTYYSFDTLEKKLDAILISFAF